MKHKQYKIRRPREPVNSVTHEFLQLVKECGYQRKHMNVPYTDVSKAQHIMYDKWFMRRSRKKNVNTKLDQDKKNSKLDQVAEQSNMLMDNDSVDGNSVLEIVQDSKQIWMRHCDRLKP